MSRAVVVLAVAACAFALASCSGGRRPAVARTWILGQPAVAFDPQGPPDPVRWALERLLARGLVEEDSAGRIVPACAESIRVSTDGLVYAFRLRSGLAFGDATPCGSADFRRALEAGLNRIDHSTYAWLLGALVGMEDVRPGRPLPPLGIATPDPQTIVLRLSRPDSLLLRKLAIPGTGVPWSKPPPDGGWAQGAGPYRIEAMLPSGMTLVRRDVPDRTPDGPDTLHVRFAPGAGRARSILRAGSADLVWPVAPGLLGQSLPAGYRVATRAARPARRLLLVMRADLRPTSRPAARHALAHGLNRADLTSALGLRIRESAGWLPGGEPFDFPRRDAEEVRAWLERGKLGRSVNAVMAYARDGAAAEAARPMQNEWARLGLDVELRPLAPAAFSKEALRYGGAQLLLLENQALLEDPAAVLAGLVTPSRGPVIGAFRSGWVTREFEEWLRPAPQEGLDVEKAQRRLAEEHVLLPLGELPWLWVEREGDPLSAHPHFGPDPASPVTTASVQR